MQWKIYCKECKGYARITGSARTTVELTETPHPFIDGVFDVDVDMSELACDCEHQDFVVETVWWTQSDMQNRDRSFVEKFTHADEAGHEYDVEFRGETGDPTIYLRIPVLDTYTDINLQDVDVADRFRRMADWVDDQHAMLAEH